MASKQTAYIQAYQIHEYEILSIRGVSGNWTAAGHYPLNQRKQTTP